jgi:hypothetical protein
VDDVYPIAAQYPNGRAQHRCHEEWHQEHSQWILFQARKNAADPGQYLQTNRCISETPHLNTVNRLGKRSARIVRRDHQNVKIPGKTAAKIKNEPG